MQRILVVLVLEHEIGQTREVFRRSQPGSILGRHIEPVKIPVRERLLCDSSGSELPEASGGSSTETLL